MRTITRLAVMHYAFGNTFLGGWRGAIDCLKHCADNLGADQAEIELINGLVLGLESNLERMESGEVVTIPESEA